MDRTEATSSDHDGGGRAEVQDLQAKIGHLSANLAQLRQIGLQAHARLERGHAEIARLRAVLQAIATCRDAAEARRIAQAALRPTRGTADPAAAAG